MTPTALPTIEAIREELRRRARASIRLADFIRQGWHVVEPATEYVPNWHIDAICQHLEAVSRGAIQNLIINIPPGHMKSLIVNVFWPAWMWLHRPGWRAIFSSYADTLTLRDSAKCRILIKSDWYQKTFGPDWSISPDQDAKFLFANTKTGSRFCTSVGGQSTGHRGDAIVVDDPLSAKEQNSDAKRAEVLFWWDQAMCNRLNNMATGSRVIIMQRLHELDLVGHVLREMHKPGGMKWEHLCLPTEFEPHRRSCTCIGWEDPRKTEGELLFPGRFPAHVIAEEKARLGSMGFAGQHQQRPSPAGGSKFRRQWFRYFDDDGDWLTLHDPAGQRRVLKSETWRFQTADLALSIKEDACFTVIASWAVTSRADCLLLDVHRERMEAPEAEAALLAAYQRWNPAFQAVEKAHYGTAVCQRFVRTGMPIKELVADKDKVTRSMTASVQMENGKFYFRSGAPWLTDYEDELLAFPNGAFDDQVDVTSYAALVLAANPAFQPSDIVRGAPRQAVQAPASPEPTRVLAGMSKRARWEDVAG